MNLQKKNESIQHEVKDQVRELKECMKKLEGELALSKNISELVSDRLVNIERQCWAHAQYSRRECVEVVAIPQSVSSSDLEKTDFNLPNSTIKLYLNESLCSHYCILQLESKALFTMGKIHSYFISNESVKIRLQEKGPSIPITRTADFKKHFLSVDLSAPRQIRPSFL